MSYNQFQMFEKIGTEESQYILEQKDLNKVHFTSGEHLANFLDKILMFA